MADAAGKSDNHLIQGLAVGAAGLAAVNAHDVVAADNTVKDPSAIDQVGGGSIKLSLEASGPASRYVAVALSGIENATARLSSRPRDFNNLC